MSASAASAAASTIASSVSSSLKKIIPLMDRVVIKRIKPLDKTASGLYIPEKAQESLNRGVVVAVGPGTKDNAMTLQEGDKVILPSYGGSLVKGGEEEIHIFKESDILAKYE